MTSLVPRSPYSEAELQQLYPKSLELQLVQVFLRHGERTPVAARFQNAGLPPHWSYCKTARRLTSAIRTTSDWDSLQYRRRLETTGPDDNPFLAAGPDGEHDAVCLPAELTDKGRQTTLALGQRLRTLYVDQLRFLPPVLSDSAPVYVRASPLPRALDSVQHAFSGLYPSSSRAKDMITPQIVTRTPAEENLYPNDNYCRRMSMLFRGFGQRAADRWNDTQDMKYLNKVLSKYMPTESPKVAVDSHPRLSGILDTVSSTLAHGPKTRLPKDFYDPKVKGIADRIVVEEWFGGLKDSHEYRTIGIGPLVGDIVSRMIGTVESTRLSDSGDIAAQGVSGSRDLSSNSGLKMALFGGHDTTVAGILGGLGAFDDEPWPPYTSHVAIELFRKRDKGQIAGEPQVSPKTASNDQPKSTSSSSSGWFSKLSTESLFKHSRGAETVQSEASTRKPLQEYTNGERLFLRDYYVRLRYNDRVMQIPGCKLPGNHLEGDTSFCTLEAFKAIADHITPRNWKTACNQNLNKPALPSEPEPAGYDHTPRWAVA